MLPFVLYCLFALSFFLQDKKSLKFSPFTFLQSQNHMLIFHLETCILAIHSNLYSTVCKLPSAQWMSWTFISYLLCHSQWSRSSRLVMESDTNNTTVNHWGFRPAAHSGTESHETHFANPELLVTGHNISLWWRDGTMLCYYSSASWISFGQCKVESLQINAALRKHH